MQAQSNEMALKHLQLQKDEEPSRLRALISAVLHSMMLFQFSIISLQKPEQQLLLKTLKMTRCLQKGQQLSPELCFVGKHGIEIHICDVMFNSSRLLFLKELCWFWLG